MFNPRHHAFPNASSSKRETALLPNDNALSTASAFTECFEENLLPNGTFLPNSTHRSVSSLYQFFTTGKRQIAVRQNVCRALFVGRTANIVFAVRFLDDARQTKTHGIHILCRASLRGRTAITNLCRAFS
jgi:hypothetical protein